VTENERLPAVLKGLRIPVIGSPMFIISGPDLVIAQCKAGIIGSFPTLNAREEKGEPIELDIWLQRITEELDHHNQINPDNPAAPFAINLIAHRTNARLERDVEICAKWRVPIWITSLGARPEVNKAAHSVDATVLHDVINNTYAHKAISKGADGLIAVAAGAGGHAGKQSPFALITEIRSWFDGPLLLAGAISTGKALLAAQVLGADLGYIGSPFIATTESEADPAYKEIISDSGAEDIVNSAVFTGIPGNYLKTSVTRSGLDPDNLPVSEGNGMSFKGGGSKPKAWKEIWGPGQGIGTVQAVAPVAETIDRIEREYTSALTRLKT